MSWWVHEWYGHGGAVLLISWAFWVIFSITLHELAHGWAALWQGDATPRRTGHMTANPIVHMGVPSLIMFAIIGIAWGQMPTDPSKYRWRRKGRIVVAGAGPAMNIALAFVSLTLGALWLRFGPGPTPGGGGLGQNLATFFFMGGMLNIVLAAFNMLPVPPLDGANVLMGFSFRIWRLFQGEQAMMIGMFIVLAIFLSGIGGLLFGVAGQLSNWYQGLLLDLLNPRSGTMG